MDASVQQYSSHARFHPPFHFFLAPVIALHLIWSLTRLVQSPSWERGEAALLSLALFVMAALVRTNPLRAQDRLIRLEEQLRYVRVLPAEMAARASVLSPAQIVAMRFASDGELPGLAERVLSGTLANPADIKKAIATWRPDTFRV